MSINVDSPWPAAPKLTCRPTAGRNIKSGVRFDANGNIYPRQRHRGLIAANWPIDTCAVHGLNDVRLNPLQISFFQLPFTRVLFGNAYFDCFVLVFQVIGSTEYRGDPALPSVAVIVVSSIVLLVMILLISVLVWKWVPVCSVSLF